VEQLFPVLAVIAVVGLGVLSLVWHLGRSHSILEHWAARNGYRLIDQSYCWFSKGPFFWTSSKGQTVYYVTVEDAAGRIRHAWVRCGGWFLGLLSEQADVEWED
jgi:hypothetical protein